MSSYLNESAILSYVIVAILTLKEWMDRCATAESKFRIAIPG